MSRDEKSTRINEVSISLPASVAIQLALVRLLRSWGVNPAAVTGHSSGEISAAFAAGVIDMETALAIVYTRGTLTTSFQKVLAQRRSMLAAGLSRDEAGPYLKSLRKGSAVVACVNSQSSVTISGDSDAIEDLEAILSANAIFARRLKVDAAYHSHHMVPIGDDYRDALSQALVRKGDFKGDVLYFSPVTGDRILDADTISDPEHWVRNMIQPVEFLDSFRNMCLSGASSDSRAISLVLEVGPHAALQGPVRQILSLPELRKSGITYHSCLRRREDAVHTMQQLACSLIESGYPLEMAAVNFPHGCDSIQMLTDLPRYPWNHSVSHWHEPRISRTLRKRDLAPHELLGSASLDSNSFARLWRNVLRLSDIPWVRDHQIQSDVVIPGAGYLGMAIEACRQAAGDEEISAYELRDVDIMKALVIPESSEGVEVQLSLTLTEDRVLASDGWHRFQIFGLDRHDTWHLHCKGLVMALLQPRDSGSTHPLKRAHGGDSLNHPHPMKRARVSDSLDHKIFHSPSRKYDVEGLYESLRSVSIKHGPIFQNIQSVSAGDGRSVCEFSPADLSSMVQHDGEQTSLLHPTTLDSVFQAVYTALPSGGNKQSEGMVPRFIHSMSVIQSSALTSGRALSAESVVRKSTSKGFEADVIVGYANSDELSEAIMKIRGLRFQSIGNAITAKLESSKLCFTTIWEADIDLFDIGDDEYRSHGTTNGSVLHEPSINGTSTNAARQHTGDSSNGHIAISSESYRMGEILRMISHKHPRASILEVGSGDGDLTEDVVDSFSSKGQDTIPTFAHYTVTDAHTAAVKAAEERFSEFAQLMSFQQLDVEDASSIKSLPTATYDIVLVNTRVAAVVQDNKPAFQSLQALVAPGGLLLLVHSSTAGLNGHTKQHALKPDESYESFVTCAKKIPIDSTTKILLSRMHTKSQTSISPIDIAIMYAGQDTRHAVESLGARLGSLLERKVEVEPLTQVNRLDEKIVVFIDNPSQSVLVNPSQQEFEALRILLLDTKGVIWVSASSEAQWRGPRIGLHHGLFRTLRCEYPLKQYVTLDFDDEAALWHDRGSTKIVDVFQACFSAEQSNQVSTDLEYAVQNWTIKIPRVVEDVVENANVAENNDSQDAVAYLSDRPIKLVAQQRGSLDSLIFVDDTSSTEPLPANHVQIRPAAFGLNFRDIMIAMGQMEETRMGYECSGYITDLHPEAAAKDFQVGDAVYAVQQGGGFANTLRIPATSIAKVPKGMDMPTAASIPMAFLTAYHCLFNMARLTRGENILIHCGAGAVGQAAIQLAQLLGANVFLTVGSPEKRQLLKQRYGIPDERIYSSRNSDFSKAIMAATNNKGVDVILNSLAGSLLRATWDCIATFGRFVEIGKRDLELNNNLPMAPFTRSVSFSSIDLMDLANLHADVIEGIFRKVNGYIEGGRISAVAPLTTFGISEIENAFRMMQSGRHIGKIVIAPNQDEQVKVISPPKAVKFSPDFTYLLVGGLGGVGQSVARWMVQKGARNLVILSRNASPRAKQTTSLAAEIQLLGATLVTEACDIADEMALETSLDRIKAKLPPIKGVIQSAMVLKDVMFEAMTLEDYQAAVRPKVHGSWNLHKLLPRGLEFFVMLSSVSGFGGNATQANYAAASTFQDALARHRAEIGEAAVSLDLGAIEGIGVLAGVHGKRAANRFRRLGMRTLNEGEVLRLVEGAVRDCCRSPSRAQVATGFPASWTRTSGSVDDSQSMETFWKRDARFLPLENLQNGAERLQSSSETDLAGLLAHADTSREDASAAVLESLVSKVASMFTVSKTDIDASSSLSRIGVDSLVAVELRNWVTIAVKVECSVFDVMQAASIMELADKLVSRVWDKKES